MTLDHLRDLKKAWDEQPRRRASIGFLTRSVAALEAMHAAVADMSGSGGPSTGADKELAVVADLSGVLMDATRTARTAMVRHYTEVMDVNGCAAVGQVVLVSQRRMDDERAMVHEFMRVSETDPESGVILAVTPLESSARVSDEDSICDYLAALAFDDPTSEVLASKATALRILSWERLDGVWDFLRSNCPGGFALRDGRPPTGYTGPPGGDVTPV